MHHILKGNTYTFVYKYKKIMSTSMQSKSLIEKQTNELCESKDKNKSFDFFMHSPPHSRSMISLILLHAN